MGIDNNIDWAVAATPQIPAGRASARRMPAQTASHAVTIANTQHSVMEKILGQHKLAASDAAGSDPYNATGRQFRR